MISGRPGAKDGYQWRITETLPWDARICAAAPVAAPAEPKFSDALAELIAWFWTEGWIGGHGQVTLTQSGAVNAQHVTRIRAALTELFGPDAKGVRPVAARIERREKRALIRAELDRDPDRSDWAVGQACLADRRTVALVRTGKADLPGWTEDTDARGISHFRLNAQAGAVLTEHAPGKVVSTEFLASLTRAQLELFYQMSVDADGIHRPSGRGAVMAQKDRARLEAFQVACALAGLSGVIRGPTRAGMWNLSIQVTPWRRPKGHAEYVSHETADLVWCVSTGNRTWYARRNGTCYFTGNTVEQSTGTAFSTVGALLAIDSTSVDGGAEIVAVSAAGNLTSIPIVNTPLRLAHAARASLQTATMVPLGPMT